jgi:hypothetical protein
MNMDAGGSIGWLSPSRSTDNVLNAFDHGRYVQQSFYGDKDGSDWNGKPWCYNPVQGGSWKGLPATVLESKVEERSLYVKTRPRQWASGEEVNDMIMEQWHRVEGGLARLRYRMTYTGKTTHQSRKHQELPAVFVNPERHTLVYCDAKEAAWTDAPLTRRQPGPPGTHGNIFHSSERWAAWVDDRDQGVGILFPHTPLSTSYRVSDSGVGNCSYLAPLQTWALQPGMSFEFEAVLALGTTKQIRSVFGKIVQQTAPEPIVEVIAGGGHAAENKPATECQVTQPFGIAFDSEDNMFICEETHRLLRVDAKTGLLTVVASAKPSAAMDDNGPARDASFKAPHNLIADTAGNLYIADTFHYRVRRIDAKTGIVTTLAGNGEKEVSGDGGPAVAAGLGWIACLAFNHDCTQLSISGDGKSGIRVVDMNTGLISTLTGHQRQSRPRRGLQGQRLHHHTFRCAHEEVSTAKYKLSKINTAIPPLAGVKHVWADHDDNILIVEASNHRIRKFIVAESKLVTLVGNGAKGSEGVPGPALQALLGEPHGSCHSSTHRGPLHCRFAQPSCAPHQATFLKPSSSFSNTHTL